MPGPHQPSWDGPVTTAIVLAAGTDQFSRDLLVSELFESTVAQLALENVRKVLPSDRIIVVFSAEDTNLRGLLGNDLTYVIQEMSLGTGNAVAAVRDMIPPDTQKLLVTYADTSLLRADSVRGLLNRHRLKNADFSLLTVIVPEPMPHGRIERDASDRASAIVEPEDVVGAEKDLHEVNLGSCVASPSALLSRIDALASGGGHRLTEVARAFIDDGANVIIYQTYDPNVEPVPDVPSPTVVPTPNSAGLIRGLENTCSEDHLWLVISVVEFARETGDDSFLAVTIPSADGHTATVSEHLKAPLGFLSAQVADNGVDVGLRADWNDCLNLGGGQTSLVTLSHAWAIQTFAEVARARGETDDIVKDVVELSRQEKVTNEQLCDGSWWTRGYTRNRVTIGSAQNEQGKIFLVHRARPVIAGITSQERGERSLKSVRKLLGSEHGCHLNCPAFTEIDDTVGFATRVYRWITENAAIFSHPNSWPIIAEALLGRGDAAVALCDAVSPYQQNDNIEVRGAEPYAYVQFIYGRDHERYGLGVRPTFSGLLIDLTIPMNWGGFTVQRKWRGTSYPINVRNPEYVSCGVTKLVVEGIDTDSHSPLPIAASGAMVSVEAALG